MKSFYHRNCWSLNLTHTQLVRSFLKHPIVLPQNYQKYSIRQMPSPSEKFSVFHPFYFHGIDHRRETPHRFCFLLKSGKCTQHCCKVFSVRHTMYRCSFCRHQRLLSDSNSRPVGYKLRAFIPKPQLLAEKFAVCCCLSQKPKLNKIWPKKIFSLY